MIRGLLFLLHLETLFVIGCIVIVVYLWWTRKKGEDTFQRLEDIATKLLYSVKDTAFKWGLPKPKKPRLNKHEERCRSIFESIFGTCFKCIRPDWLKNPATNKNLELDGFNPNIITPIGRGLAFEYDGIQHAKYTPTFQRGGPKEFEYQFAKDSWKDMRCKERGVLLIRIPHNVAYEDLEDHIRHKLHRGGMGKYLSSTRRRQVQDTSNRNLVSFMYKPRGNAAPARGYNMYDTLVPKARRDLDRTSFDRPGLAKGQSFFDTLVPKARRDLDRTSFDRPGLAKGQSFFDTLVPKARRDLDRTSWDTYR